MAKFMIDEFRSELITGFGISDVSQHKSYFWELEFSGCESIIILYSTVLYSAESEDTVPLFFPFCISCFKIAESILLNREVDIQPIYLIRMTF